MLHASPSPLGVGGIESEAVMLGQPVSLTLPQVVGCKLVGSINPLTTSIDIVLGITKVKLTHHLRSHSVSKTLFIFASKNVLKYFLGIYWFFSIYVRLESLGGLWSFSALVCPSCRCLTELPLPTCAQNTMLRSAFSPLTKSHSSTLKRQVSYWNVTIFTIFAWLIKNHLIWFWLVFLAFIRKADFLFKFEVILFHQLS